MADYTIQSINPMAKHTWLPTTSASPLRLADGGEASVTELAQYHKHWEARFDNMDRFGNPRLFSPRKTRTTRKNIAQMQSGII